MSDNKLSGKTLYFLSSDGSEIKIGVTLKKMSAVLHKVDSSGFHEIDNKTEGEKEVGRLNTLKRFFAIFLVLKQGNLPETDPSNPKQLSMETVESIFEVLSKRIREMPGIRVDKEKRGLNFSITNPPMGVETWHIIIDLEDLKSEILALPKHGVFKEIITEIKTKTPEEPKESEVDSRINKLRPGLRR